MSITLPPGMTHALAATVGLARCALCLPRNRHNAKCEACQPGCLDNLPASGSYAAWVKAGRPEWRAPQPIQTALRL